MSDQQSKHTPEEFRAVGTVYREEEARISRDNYALRSSLLGMAAFCDFKAAALSKARGREG